MPRCVFRNQFEWDHGEKCRHDNFCLSHTHSHTHRLVSRKLNCIPLRGEALRFFENRRTAAQFVPLLIFKNTYPNLIRFLSPKSAAPLRGAALLGLGCIRGRLGYSTEGSNIFDLLMLGLSIERFVSIFQ